MVESWFAQVVNGYSGIASAKYRMDGYHVNVRVLVEVECVKCQKKRLTTAKIEAAIERKGKVKIDFSPNLPDGWTYDCNCLPELCSPELLCEDHQNE